MQDNREKSRAIGLLVQIFFLAFVSRPTNYKSNTKQDQVFAADVFSNTVFAFIKCLKPINFHL